MALSWIQFLPNWSKLLSFLRPVLLAGSIMPCRCAPGFGSWATSVLTFLLMSLTWCPATTVCGWYTALYCSLTIRSEKWTHTALQTCLTSLPTWFYTNIMELNPNKYSAVLLSTAQTPHTSVYVAGTPVQLVKNTKLLGVTLDTKLTMWHHAKRVSQSCCNHICAFCHTCSVLDKSIASDIALALVSSRLDYANSVF